MLCHARASHRGRVPHAVRQGPGRDLFAVALAEAFDELPDPAETSRRCTSGPSEATNARSCTGRYGRMGRPPSRPRRAGRGVCRRGRARATPCSQGRSQRRTRGGACLRRRKNASASTRRDDRSRRHSTAPSSNAPASPHPASTHCSARGTSRADATERDLADIAVKNHANAARNA